MGVSNPEKLETMKTRVKGFIERCAAQSLVFDFENEDIIAQAARRALALGVVAYAKGEATEADVERLARLYVDGCRRPEPKPARKTSNEPPPTYTEQRKQTYNYQQGHTTQGQLKARKRMQAADDENRRISEQIFWAGVAEHKANYPNCTGLHCPYCAAH